MSTEVRVRFAPSPTGALHIGGVRTALYNYLYAKKNKGKFLLRIEDTDQTRFVEGAEDYIKKSLEWIGITPDESIWNPGECGPYRQSERKALYGQYAQKLVDEGNAYYAFDTPEEIEAMRERLRAARVVSPQYNGITRATMKNSLTLPEDEVKRRLEAGDAYVIRLKVPRKEEIRLNDMVRGWVKVLSTDIDDKVLMKSDGMPTYHLANVVDDYLMKITHVIRGEEWLPSAPSHVLLYKFLGWESEMPQFAHLPLILKPDGNGKLSKRAADQLGFPIFPLNWDDPVSGELSEGFKEKGYLSDALVNFLAFLGWNPGNHQEIFSLEELIEAFSVERIGKSGTKFDLDKIKWYNQQYIKAKSNEELAPYLLVEAEKAGISCTPEKAAKIVGLLKERVSFPNEFWENASYFFSDPEKYDEKVVKKKWNETTVQVFSELIVKLDDTESFSGQELKETLAAIAENKGFGIGKFMQPLRMATTGLGMGPELTDVLDLLGREVVINRLKKAVDVIPA